MAAPHHVTVNGLSIGNDLPLVLIAGPCLMESRSHALECAHALAEIARDHDLGLIYKSSFDKANRTSGSAARGIGLAQALPIFAEIRSSLGLPVLTDVHDAAQFAADRGIGDLDPGAPANVVECAQVALALRDLLVEPCLIDRRLDHRHGAAHEGVPEAVHAGVLLVARARVAADPRSLAGP